MGHNNVMTEQADFPFVFVHAKVGELMKTNSKFSFLFLGYKGVFLYTFLQF